MRIVSWVVVVGSIGWLLAYNLRPTLSLSLPPVALDQVSGTALMQPDAASAADLQDFAVRYTEAWNSHDPARVASFYAQDGSISINGGDPYAGPSGLTRMASNFLTAFPDLHLTMTGLKQKDDRLVYQWMFTGTHADTGKRVRITGSETWHFGEDGLIAESRGHFDARDYDRQVAYGYQP